MKFRVWDKEEEIFIRPSSDDARRFTINMDGKLIVAINMFVDSFLDVMNEDEVRDRFAINYSSGIYDKNEVEIYEDDIIKNNYDNVFIVCFGEYDNGERWGDNEGGVGFFMKRLTLIGYEHMDICGMLTSEYSIDYEIIGNIYENPELIEVKNE